MKQRIACIIAGVIGLSVVPIAGGIPAENYPPPDAPAIQAGIHSLVQSLESAKEANTATSDEFLIIAYQLAQGRPPTPAEFFTLRMLHVQERLSREQILLLALQNEQGEITWGQCRTFLEKADSTGFAGTAATRALAKSLAKTSIDEVVEKLLSEAPSTAEFPVVEKDSAAPQPNIEYTPYFGDLHNHSNLSHGLGTADEAYTYARDVAELDFFSLSDHSELMIFWPWDDKWEHMRETAEKYNAPGEFVTLWGFEWSNPLLGHINVFNTDEMTNCIATFTLWSLYKWIEARPEAFGTFNHPGFFNYAIGEFQHFAFPPGAPQQMVGIETFNECLGFDFYYYQNRWGADLPYIDLANTRGWNLGPLGGDDNHVATWDTRCPARTVVLATELTREAIIEAYRARRFYSTENMNLFLDFRCAGYPMGSHLDGIPRTFTVSAHDADGTPLKEVRLYRNGILRETKAANASAIEVTFSDLNALGKDYYYVIAVSTLGVNGGRPCEAMSSPIWFAAASTPQPGCAAVAGATLPPFDPRYLPAWAVVLIPPIVFWRRGMRKSIKIV